MSQRSGSGPARSWDEVMEEAQLSQDHILRGIERFARERDARIRTLREAVEAADKHE